MKFQTKGGYILGAQTFWLALSVCWGIWEGKKHQVYLCFTFQIDTGIWYRNLCLKFEFPKTIQIAKEFFFKILVNSHLLKEKECWLSTDLFRKSRFQNWSFFFDLLFLLWDIDFFQKSMYLFYITYDSMKIKLRAIKKKFSLRTQGPRQSLDLNILLINWK